MNSTKMLTLLTAILFVIFSLGALYYMFSCQARVAETLAEVKKQSELLEISEPNGLTNHLSDSNSSIKVSLVFVSEAGKRSMNYMYGIITVGVFMAIILWIKNVHNKGSV